jgi:hypothetical protein
MRLPMRLSPIIVGALAALLGCSDDLSGPPGGNLPGFSFESGMEGWTVHGVDLEVGGQEIDWSIAPSRDRAAHGEQSLRFFLDNMTDAAKIWAERAVGVRPNRTYDVQVRFSLASADFGSANLFRVIAGAFASPPRTREELAPAFRDETGNGSSTDVGYQWQTRTYTTTVTSGASGQIHVVVGIWGTWESARTYYVDDIRITATGR